MEDLEDSRKRSCSFQQKRWCSQ